MTRAAHIQLAASAALVLAVTCHQYPSWPDLPRIHFISGHAATSQDVRRGDAAFAFERGGQYVGHPVHLEIPQYAWYYDRDFTHMRPDTWRQVVLIQAERSPSGELWYGFRHDPKHIGGIMALEQEIIVLGTVNPGRIPPHGKAPTTAPPSYPASDSRVNVILGAEREAGGA